MNLQRDLYNSKFSYIYVEEKAFDHPRTKKILEKFPNSKIIKIVHYKDIFNRKHQNYRAQHNSQALILAVAEEISLYEGARVCQSFGNEFFYYTSNIMNCLFDCDYCFLKGMYPSGNMVIFVNIEDVFRSVEEVLLKHPVYLCVSYDTDLTALEEITGFVKEWMNFTYKHPDLTIEIRTKSPRTDFYNKMTPCSRVIFAYTISPDYVVRKYEHDTGSMQGRINAVKYALERGFSVRLCFDPMIYCPDWKQEYQKMIKSVSDNIDLNCLTDISIGSFRISQEYMKQMRKNMPYSAVAQFPYENIHGVYQYPDRIRDSMEEFLLSELSAYISTEKIYRWEEK